MLTARRTAPEVDDAGMTLTELLVGMGLLLVVMTLGVNFFVGTGRTAARVTGQTLNAQDARTAMNQVATLLRLADTPSAQAGYPTARFTTITASEVVFYSNVNAGSRSGATTRKPPDKIDIVASGSKLIEKRYAPKIAYSTYPSGYDYTTNYPTTPTSTSVLLSSLANTAVFTYCTNATDPTVKCTLASSGESVSSVGVTLTAKGLTGENDQTAQSMISITGALS